jgi:hypothetical protein
MSAQPVSLNEAEELSDEELDAIAEKRRMP